MPELNEEQALSYAESMVNWMRSLRYLEDVCRFVRGTRAQIPILQEQFEQATQKKVKAEQLSEAAEASTRERLAGFEADIRVAQEHSAREVQALKAEIVGQRQVIDQERERFRRETEALHMEFSKTRDALVREEAALRERIAKLNTELDALKQRAARL